MLYDREVSTAIARWGPRYGVRIEPSVVHGILENETRHGRDARYVRAGGAILEPDGDHSYGPMMVKGSTARSELGIVDLESLKKPAVGISAGVHYFARLLRHFGGDVRRAVTAYNGAGPRARAYAVRVLEFARRYAVVAVPAAALVALMVVLFLIPRRRARI